MNQNLLDRVNIQKQRYKSLVTALDHTNNVLLEANKQLDLVLKEQDLLERTTLAIQQARPLLSASSIKQCEELANSALKTIFGFDAKVQWDVESNMFVLDHDGFQTSLVDSEGGGIVSVISFVFQLFLLVKLHKRKFFCFDEAFYAVSDKYLESFITFVIQSAHDLNVDILWISHDVRINPEWADSVYIIEDGVSRKIK